MALPLLPILVIAAGAGLLFATSAKKGGATPGQPGAPQPGGGPQQPSGPIPTSPQPGGGPQQPSGPIPTSPQPMPGPAPRPGVPAPAPLFPIAGPETFSGANAGRPRPSVMVILGTSGPGNAPITIAQSATGNPANYTQLQPINPQYRIGQQAEWIGQALNVPYSWGQRLQAAGYVVHQDAGAGPNVTMTAGRMATGATRPEIVGMATRPEIVGANSIDAHSGAVVEWTLMNNRDPEQLEALAAFTRHAPNASSRLLARAKELRAKQAR